MYCPKCGAENPEGAQLCHSCGWVMSSTSTGPRPDAKTSGLAITSLVLGILSFFTLFLTALPAIIFGIISLVKISKSSGQLKGKGLAIAGIAVPVALLPMIALLMSILMPALARVRSLSERVVCGTNLKQIGVAMMIYAENNNGQYPTADRWCDLLKSDCAEKQFVCPSAEQGRCHYAINPNAAPDSPPDTVLVFETGPGWNQSGGREILTVDNHCGEGCNVLFVDGYVEFIEPEDVNDLKWTSGERMLE